MTLYLSKAWSMNLERIWVYLGTYIDTQALGQQIGHFITCCAKAEEAANLTLRKT